MWSGNGAWKIQNFQKCSARERNGKGIGVSTNAVNGKIHGEYSEREITKNKWECQQNDFNGKISGEDSGI